MSALLITEAYCLEATHVEYDANKTQTTTQCIIFL